MGTTDPQVLSSVIGTSLTPVLTQFKTDVLANVPPTPPPAPVNYYNIPAMLPPNEDHWMHLMLWYDKAGSGKALIPGYTSYDPVTVTRQLTLMKLMNVKYIHADWRGPWNVNETKTFAEFVKQCPTFGMKIAGVIDKDAALKGPSADHNQNFIDAVKYLFTTFGASLGFYTKYIFEYGCINKGVNFDVVDKAVTQAPILHGGLGTIPAGTPTRPFGFRWDEDASIYAKNLKSLRLGSYFCGFNDANPLDPAHSMWSTPTKPLAARLHNSYNISTVYFQCFADYRAAKAVACNVLEGCMGRTWNDYTERTTFENEVERATGKSVATGVGF